MLLTQITRLLLFALLFNYAPLTFAKEIQIGVLAFSGKDYALNSWQPTVDYLNEQIPEHEFSLVAVEPNNIEQLDQLVQQQQLDFVITQPVTFIELQVKYSASSVLTLVDESQADKFGSVIFVRSDSSIEQLSHLKGRSIAGANPKGLGGWLIGYNEIINQGVDAFDESMVSFLGVQENIVNAVLAGDVDAGIVRTGVLERLANSRAINLSDLKVLNAKQVADFPYLLSTDLYPEWALVKSSHTPKTIAKKVASALLSMAPNSHAAKARGYWEWVTPVDYQPIRELMQKLRIGVYQDYGKVSLLQYVKDNLVLSSLLLTVLLILMVTGLLVLKLNKRLKAVNYFVEQQNNMILDSVSEGIYGVDLNGNCTFINRALTKLTGWNKSDMLGKFQHEILHHTHADGSAHLSEDCPVYQTFVDGEPKYIKGDVFWKKNGERIFVEYNATPIKDKFDKIVGSVVVFRDITQQIQLQEAQQQHERDVEHVARLNTMGEIVTGIAHELNQPLTVISTLAFSGAKLLESDKHQTKKLLEIFETLLKQSEHAANVIKHMRKMSDKDRSDFSLASLNDRIQAVLVLLDATIKDKQITLVTNLDPLLPKTPIQTVQIDQVLLNLCKNAIDAMHTRSQAKTLTISTKLVESYIEVLVEDTGSGIDQSIIDRLFDPFSSKKKNGMGIGLSISRSIIERHYGSLTLEKTSKSGTRFKFVLPIEIKS